MSMFRFFAPAASCHARTTLQGFFFLICKTGTKIEDNIVRCDSNLNTRDRHSWMDSHRDDTQTNPITLYTQT